MIECSCMSIYDDIKKPVISLAPMEDVTDTVFRQIINSIQRPDLFYTEFVNVEGLNSVGREKVIHRLKYDPTQNPIIAQLWGIKPKNFFKGAQLVKELGFDGVDINMGCSVKKVVQRKAGSGLITQERDIVKRIIERTREGAVGLPVSVKTRLGWDSYDFEWIEFLIEQDLDVLTFNAVTAKGDMSLVPNWDIISKIVRLRDDMRSKTLIFGNGGISSLKQAKEYAKKYCVDGVMIGRAALSNPWIFSQQDEVSTEERIEMLREQVILFQKTWGKKKSYNKLKKFIKTYINGFSGSQEIREDLMECKSIEELLEKTDNLFD